MVLWQDFTTENADGTARKTGKFAKFLQRDESGAEATFEVYFPSVSSDTVHPTFAGSTRRRIYVPSWAELFQFFFAGKVTFGGTGYLRATLGGIAAPDVTFTATNPSEEIVTVSWSDVASLQGQSVELLIQLAHSGGGSAFARANTHVGGRFSRSG